MDEIFFLTIYFQHFNNNRLPSSSEEELNPRIQFLKKGTDGY